MPMPELRAQYEALIASADAEDTVLELSRQIRKDIRLNNMERNMLWSSCASRRGDLARGKDGQATKVVGAPAEPAAPIPANLGGNVSALSPSPSAAGEISLEDAKILWDRFQAFKMAVIERGDFDLIEGKKDLNRSGWSKIGTALGISVQILDRDVSGIGENLKVSFWVRASKGNRFVDNVASCEAFEIAAIKPTFHLVETKAYTRAMKRAIADLVGGAETE